MKSRWMHNVCAAVLTVVLTACSESQRPLLPESSGRAYEVLIASDDTVATNFVDSLLSTDCEGLPQREPRFDVVKAGTATLNATTQMARSIIVVNTADSGNTTTTIRYEKDVCASPQIVVLVSAPSANELRRDLQGQMAERLRRLIENHEMTAERKRLSKNGDAWAQRQADSLLHVKMLIPKELTRHKRGIDFLWLSIDAPQAMRNICLYSYSGVSLRLEELTARRDSIMQKNMPGEHDGMYMKTAQTAAVRQEQGRLVVTGLWEMHGDMMGGPFVAHAIVDSSRQRIVVAEGFAYAPEQQKRNIMRQLEAALYTLSINK